VSFPDEAFLDRHPRFFEPSCSYRYLVREHSWYARFEFDSDFGMYDCWSLVESWIDWE